MNEKPIKENPSIRKIQDDIKGLTAFKNAWPLLRPLFKIFGAKVQNIDNALKQVDNLKAQAEDLISVPDDFNDLFADRGWIMYSHMNIDIAKKAIELGKLGQLEESEKTLVDFYTSEEIERELKSMIYVKAFVNRMPLATKALTDFKEGRYYSTVLVILSLLDGMVNEIQQKSFFSKDVDLTAWDSVAAHSKGLQKLTEILAQSRKKTRTEQMTIPYRHGIMHGMDLGYDNKLVAVKSWVALFATRDWAVKAEGNQLVEPPPKPELTWKELIQRLHELDNDKKALANWKPRNIIVGIDVPFFGEPNNYDNGSPEQKMSEFLNYWQASNYGFMARCISTKIGHPQKELPKRIREEYFNKLLESWQLHEVRDEAPAITVISIRAIYMENNFKQIKTLEARLICEDDRDFGRVRGKPGTRWALVTWYLKETGRGK